MIRTIIHPSGAVLDLPDDTLCTYAPSALDGMVGLAVETKRYDDKGNRSTSENGGPWDHDFILEYPTSLKARRRAEKEAIEEYGPSGRGWIREVEDCGSHGECELSSQSLGERCLVFLGERDARGRRLWRLARREVPRPLIDEAERLLLAANLPAARKNFDEAMRECGVLGYGLRLAIVQAERAGLDASGLVALRAQCHTIVGHNHGA